MGQLNDLVQADLFYARDITGTNHVFLGAIDAATNLHQVRLLADRSPETCLGAFREMWIRPYGAPLKLQDGCFQGEMWLDSRHTAWTECSLAFETTVASYSA